MSAVSLSIKRGAGGFQISDFTVDTQAPNANDVELRFNLTDANSAALTKEDVILALDAFERALLSGALFTNSPPL